MADAADNDPEITRLKRKMEAAQDHVQQVKTTTNDKNMHQRAQADADTATQDYMSAYNKKKGPGPNQGSALDLLRNWATKGSLSGK